MTARIRDVTLRDGLQLTDGRLSAADRVGLVRALLALGVDSLEIGSMARPDLVPSMAPTLEVVAALTPEELERCWVWVATPGQVARAAAAGVRGVQYCLSVTDEHNRANVARTTEQSMAALPEALEIAAAHDVAVQLCLATAFTCPFTGPVDPERVLTLVADERGAGCSDVVVADTLGQANPAEVRDLVHHVVVEAADRPVSFHGHDTWGMGVANALAAIEAGADTVDGALGGLGGCPFAPGASGNTATEDLVFALRPDWLDQDGFRTLVGLGEGVLASLGQESRSRSAQGARSKAGSFGWTFAAAG
ncbi:hydroxymethylglutaryl-CoA lyase [Mariniluteicoccus endophyticus]